MNNLFKKTFLGLVIFTLVFSTALSMPQVTQAQNKVPTAPDTKFNWHNIQQQLKDFTLKGVAWSVAKMALQQLTTSVVNWINTGFQGSPAFLTDPEGFFIDLADQETGMLIGDEGPLRNLCSPWNVDIRLSLALGQTPPPGKRYECTLGAIINNAKGASVNGYSIEGFTSGDFSQGGWPAFISMTSEPQNNPYGSYLQAKSDLEAQIFNKQNKVNTDLNRGQGFLSWQKCSPVVIDGKGTGRTELGLDSRDQAQLNNTGAVTTQNGGKYTTTKDEKTGVTTYNKCSTQTPGSVIGSSLNKQLGASTDVLGLADDINEITSALFAQLMSQVLTKGLGGSTKRSSGSTQSYIDQLYAESSGKGAYANSAGNIQAEYGPYVIDARNIEVMYGQAVTAFQNTRAKFVSAQGCFQDITVDALNPEKHAEAQGNLNQIQNILITQVAVAETTYRVKRDQAISTVDTIKLEVDKARAISDAQSAADSIAKLQNFISTQVPLIAQGRTTAQTDLTAAQAQTTGFDKVADQYIEACQTLKNKPKPGGASISGGLN